MAEGAERASARWCGRPRVPRSRPVTSLRGLPGLVVTALQRSLYVGVKCMDVRPDSARKLAVDSPAQVSPRDQSDMEVDRGLAKGDRVQLINLEDPGSRWMKDLNGAPGQ